VNKAARRCAKITAFNKQPEKIGLIHIDPLEAAKAATTIDNVFTAEKLFAHCAEHKLFKEFYLLTHKLPEFKLER